MAHPLLQGSHRTDRMVILLYLARVASEKYCISKNANAERPVSEVSERQILSSEELGLAVRLHEQN